MACCTWEDCERPAEFPQVSLRGRVWADLCAAHNKALKVAEDDATNVAAIIDAWAKAQGGAGTQLVAPLNGTP